MLEVLICVVSYRMTEKERERAQEQLEALSQAYSELAQQCSEQTTSAEEVGCFFSSIGVLVSYSVSENSATWWSAA